MQDKKSSEESGIEPQQVVHFSGKLYNRQRLKIKKKLQQRYKNSGIHTISDSSTIEKSETNPGISTTGSQGGRRRRPNVDGIHIYKAQAGDTTNQGGLGESQEIENTHSKPARKVADQKRRDKVKKKYAGSEINTKSDSAINQRDGVYTASESGTASKATQGAAAAKKKTPSYKQQQRKKYQNARERTGIHISSQNDSQGTSSTAQSTGKGEVVRETVYSALDIINSDDNAGVESVTTTARTVDKAVVYGNKTYVGAKEAVKKTQSNYRRVKNYWRAQKGKGAKQLVSDLANDGFRAMIAAVKKTASKAVTSMLAFMGPVIIGIIIVFALLAVIAAVLTPSMSIAMATYPSEDKDITDSTLQMTDLCEELKEEIINIGDQPEWAHIDEIRYIPSLEAILAEIDYDPFILQAYLAAIYDKFDAAQVESEIQSLFDEMFKIITEEIVEIREMEVYNPDTEEYETIEYEYYILEVSLEKKPLEQVVEERLADNEEARKKYEVYVDKELHGLHQVVSNPFDIDWTSVISCKYGWRSNPTHPEQGDEFHTGLDIAMPTGTPIKAGVTGTVTRRSSEGPYGNRVEITSMDGKVRVLYAHMSSINVSEGDIVMSGFHVVGAVGATGNVTGPHLHIEVYIEGVRYDPLFLVASNE